MAAGGGGDAVGALLARRALGDTDERPPLVTTCAWERLRIDPVPGPRSRTDFTGLGLIGSEAVEVLPDSDTVPSGRSVLPRLAQTSGARVFLHDFEGGSVGLAGQLQRLATSIGVDQLVVIDVGGDILARGPESELRSPLADSLTMAAALQTEFPTSVVVLGPGADAELPEGRVLGLLEDAGSRLRGKITAGDVRNLEPVLSWHPTEASAVVAAAAAGLRGSVAMRRGRLPVPITDRTPQLWNCPLPIWTSFPLANALRETDSLAAAERVMRAVALNEIDYERRVAAETPLQRPPMDLPSVISDMKAVGATHITNRRLSETLIRREFDEVATASGCQSTNRMWSLEDLVRLVGAIGGS